VQISVPDETFRNSDTIIWTINFTGPGPGATGTFVDNNNTDLSNATNDPAPNLFDPTGFSIGDTTPANLLGPVVTNGTQFVFDNNGILFQANSPSGGGTQSVNSFDFDLILPDGVTSVTITGEVVSSGSFANEFIGIDFSNASASVETDTDGDGIADRLDLDSDNDGISDLVESGADANQVDTNNDGILDGSIDIDSDGLLEVAGATDNDTSGANATDGQTPIDSDSDGITNFIDLDSDNDGISDLAESGANAALVDIDNDGRLDGTIDIDNDGRIDSVGTETTDDQTPVDTDSDGIANFIDLDSDFDGITDFVEGQSTAGFVASDNTDADSDGLTVNVDIDDADANSGALFDTYLCRH